MSNDWSRRELLATIGGALVSTTAGAVSSSPAPLRRLARPYLVASDNALRSKNAAGSTVAADCLARLARQERTLGAIVAAIEISELDPDDTSVGYGGLPNADGVVELDAAVMECGRDGARRAGGVAALCGVKTPARVALAVADTTPHHLLAGAGARAFARAAGFAADDDLSTERSRAAWREWRARTGTPAAVPGSAADAFDPGRDFDAVRQAMVSAGTLDPLHRYGTIHLSAVGFAGDVASSTSTSGLAFKPPGRIGDSPILGAGLYCDATAGAAGSTGLGEANLIDLVSFWIVEEMRRGAHPKDAGMAALRRVRERAPAARRRGGEPAFGLQFYVLDLEGRAAGLSLYRDFDGGVARFVAGDREGIELRECESLLERFRSDAG